MIQPLMIMNLVPSASGTRNYLKINIPSVCVVFICCDGLLQFFVIFLFPQNCFSDFNRASRQVWCSVPPEEDKFKTFLPPA